MGFTFPMIRSREEQDFLSEFNNLFWIGASNATKWLDGSDIIYNNFAPNVERRARVLTLAMDSLAAGSIWRSTDYRENVYTVCERVLKSALPTNTRRPHVPKIRTTPGLVHQSRQDDLHSRFEKLEKRLEHLGRAVFDKEKNPNATHGSFEEVSEMLKDLNRVG